MRARQRRSVGRRKGQLLIATRFGDVDQLHLVEQPAGERRQLTFLREPITAGRVFARSRRAALTCSSRMWAATKTPSSTISAWANPRPNC